VFFMTDYTLDITGKVCPYCILAVQKDVKKMQ
jgi:TusA-related sulfurtransferase